MAPITKAYEEESKKHALAVQEAIRANIALMLASTPKNSS